MRLATREALLPEFAVRARCEPGLCGVLPLRTPKVDDLSVKQEQAIVALLSEPTIRKAAAKAEVSERSIYGWLREKVFSKAYRQARRDAFSQAIALTQKYAPLAVNTLANLMADPKTPAHARVTAATTILKFGREGPELEDLEARIQALEEEATRQGGRLAAT